MDWIKKLLGELVATIIVLIVGRNVIGNVHYNEMLKHSYWRAFLLSPIRFIRNNIIKEGIYIRSESRDRFFKYIVSNQKIPNCYKYKFPKGVLNGC